MDCFKSNGVETTEYRALDEFEEVDIEDKMEVEIVYGKEHSVKVDAGSHLLSNISTVVSDGVLKIENRNTCNFVRGYKRMIHITITTPYIKKLVHKGVGPTTINMDQDSIFVRAENSGDIYVNGIFKQIRTSSHGNGDIYLDGSTNSLMIYTYGTNYTKAANMVVEEYVYIATYSIGDAELNLSSKASLDYLIWSKGNIYYQGEPIIIRDLSEGQYDGKLIKEN